jgi:hypothetical protein
VLAALLAILWRSEAVSGQYSQEGSLEEIQQFEHERQLLLK